MEKNFKCFICGTLTGVFFLVNANNICEECLKHIINTPHIEVQFPSGPTGPDRNPGIEMNAAGTTAFSISSSSSSSSLITTLPPKLG